MTANRTAARAELTDEPLDALAAAYHELHCRGLFGDDVGHSQVGAEVDRAKARFLLASVADRGWQLCRTEEPNVVTTEE